MKVLMGKYGKIIYKWAIVHGYVSHNQRVVSQRVFQVVLT
jgi:hypothetical protein